MRGERGNNEQGLRDTLVAAERFIRAPPGMSSDRFADPSVYIQFPARLLGMKF